MTVGQRIAQKRKEFGLSQETLGERLGVSRQAIYKWESGAALPEIEKLVALSRLFAVPVGWLLGVEETPEQEPQGGELTEAQLAMVEEIVRRYQAAQPQPPEPKRRRRWPWVVAVLILIVVFVRLFSTLSAMQNKYSQLQNSINQYRQNLDIQINSIAGQVENALDRLNSFTVEQSAKILSADLTANTVTFQVSAAPKTYTEGMTALFRAEYGDGTVEVDAQWNGTQSCTAELTCPLTDEIVLSVVFQTGDKQETQKVQTFYDLYTGSFPAQSAYIASGPLFFELEGGTLTRRDYAVKLVRDTVDTAMPTAELADLRLGMFEDNALVFWMQQLDEQPDTYRGDWSEHLFFRSTQSYTFDQSKTYCLAAVITDEYGRDIVCADLPVVYENGDWTYASDGSTSRDPADWEY